MVQHENKSGRTVRTAVTGLAAAFREAGLDTPERDARRLVAAAIRGTATDLLRAPERVLSSAEDAELTRFEKRRLAHEPVSRILGHRDFYGRTFRIDRATLDPRPETETLIEEALAICQAEGWTQKPIRILDIGTGSGCILLTLLSELSQATGIGSDISEDALKVARENARSMGLADRASFRKARTWRGVPGPFDLVLSNPPYIASKDIPELAEEVRDFDPPTALDGGADGLDIYREIAAGLPAAVPSGWIVLEVGAGQAEAVANLMTAAGAAPQGEIKTRKDLAGLVRCVAVRTQQLLGTH